LLLQFFGLKQFTFKAKQFVLFSVILIGGQFPHEGNVFARNPAINFFGPVCDDNWGVEDVSVQITII
jgi:hypothetical protein